MFYVQFLQLCQKHSVKPSRVALDLGFSKATATKWKSGSNPNGETLQKIAAYFNVSTDYLLSNEKKPTTQESSELAEIEKLIQDAKNRKANETMILKYSGGKPEAVILSDEEMKIIDVLIENAKNRQK